MSDASPTAADLRAVIFDLAARRGPVTLTSNQAPDGFHPRARFETQPCRFSSYCTGTAGLYADLCDHHALATYKCEVRPSLVPDAGNGLFALEPFGANDCIDIYDGNTFAHDAEAESKVARPYGFLIEDNNLTVDAASTQSCIARYVNHSADKANCTFRRFKINPEAVDTFVVLETARPIEAGEELLVNYGKYYLAAYKA